MIDLSDSIEKLLTFLEREFEAKLNFIETNSDKMDTETNDDSSEKSEKTKLEQIFLLEKETDKIIQSIFL